MEKNKDIKVTNVALIIMGIIILVLTILLLIVTSKLKIKNETLPESVISTEKVETKTTTLLSKEEALNIGKDKYEQAFKYYFRLKLSEDPIKIQYNGHEVGAQKITNIKEIKDLFTENKFNKYIGKITDEADNYNIIIEKNGEYYRLDADRGGSTSYLYTDDLEVKNITDNKITFVAKSYYLANTDLVQEFASSHTEPKEYVKNASKENIKILSNEFILVKENGIWKVDYFVMPS